MTRHAVDWRVSYPSFHTCWIVTGLNNEKREHVLKIERTRPESRTGNEFENASGFMRAHPPDTRYIYTHMYVYIFFKRQEWRNNILLCNIKSYHFIISILRYTYKCLLQNNFMSI